MLLTLLPSEHEKPTHGYHNNSATIHFFTQRDVNIHPSNKHKKYHKPRGYRWASAYLRAFFQNNKRTPDITE